MAVKKDYTSELMVESFLNVLIVSGEADNYMNSAIDIVELYTGRVFIADTDASIKYFNGSGNSYLRIEDCVDVTKVERGLDGYGDSFEEISDGGYNGYYLLPENNIVDGGGTYPVQQIHLRDRMFLRGIKNAKITAKWGYSIVCPDDVKMATTIIAGGIYNFNRSAGSGDIESEKIGNYSVTYDVSTGGGNWGDYRRALAILDNYKRFNI